MSERDAHEGVSILSLKIKTEIKFPMSSVVNQISQSQRDNGYITDQHQTGEDDADKGNQILDDAI